jgi:hypothetical protein
MTPMLWQSLRLEPRPKLETDGGRYVSKLAKLFPWPSIDDPSFDRSDA